MLLTPAHSQASLTYRRYDMEIQRFPELDSLIDGSSQRLTDTLLSIQSEPEGVARVVLTGGTAGIALLRRMAEPDRASGIDWSRVHVFFGDERNVPVDHPDSNEGQAREALLDHVPIPEENIHGYGLTGGEMDEAVDAYRRIIAEFAPNGFDVHLLGMGGEGHINSLFPHTDAVREDNELAVAVTDSPKPPAERATLTLPAVRSARGVWFLVSGAEKAEAAAHLAARSDPLDWPASGARGLEETVLFVTEDAASLIP